MPIREQLIKDLSRLLTDKFNQSIKDAMENSDLSKIETVLLAGLVGGAASVSAAMCMAAAVSFQKTGPATSPDQLEAEFSDALKRVTEVMSMVERRERANFNRWRESGGSLMEYVETSDIPASLH